MLLFTPAFIPDAAVATDRKREANPTAWIRYLVFLRSLRLNRLFFPILWL
jgi:hypothetical protein